jgi:hypothetical protein
MTPDELFGDSVQCPHLDRCLGSARQRIEQAKADWKDGRFDTVPGDAEEFIPLPEAGKVASYP